MPCMQPCMVGRLPAVRARSGFEGIALACGLLTSCDAAPGRRARAQLPNTVGLTAAWTLLGRRARSQSALPAGCRGHVGWVLRLLACSCVAMLGIEHRRAAARYSQHASQTLALAGVQLGGCQLLTCEYRGRGRCAGLLSAEQHGVAPTRWRSRQRQLSGCTLKCFSA